MMYILLEDGPGKIAWQFKLQTMEAEYPMHHKRSKHIDIKYHWLREHTYEDGTIHFEHCITKDMVADVMTKALPFDLHSKHAKNITGNGNE